MEPGVKTICVVVVATDAHPGLRNATDTLKKHGHEFRVLGEGQAWRGWRQRMDWYRAAASTLPGDSLVVCMDAYDALCLRSPDRLEEVFRSFGKPLVFSVESFCGGNCVPLKSWWSSDLSKPFQNKDGTAPEDRYVNGGLLMGYAKEVANLYGWMLKENHNDDQVGLGSFALAHPDLWAPDPEHRIFKNRLFNSRLTDEDLQGKGCFFAHFPGMRDWGNAGYEQAVRHLLHRPSLTHSHNRGTPAKFALAIVALVVLSITLLLVVTLAALHFARTYRSRLNPRRASAHNPSYVG